MLPARRFLPSLSLLSAFEAAARTGSVTAAAKELQLTQSAVSRQIRLLDEQLGADLFLRERQTGERGDGESGGERGQKGATLHGDISLLD